MAGFSKLAPMAVARVSLGNLSPKNFRLMAVREGHAHLFRRRPGQLLTNRLKDIAHFYLIGVGMLPCALVVVICHIIFGPNCELVDYPEQGHPHFWQFERTPLRQFYARVLGVSDVEIHERNMALSERNSIMARWRRFEQRVKHLEGERWDYKGFYYEPVSAHWVDYCRYQAERYSRQYEPHGHYPY